MAIFQCARALIIYQYSQKASVQSEPVIEVTGGVIRGRTLSFSPIEEIAS
jgi:hypothetical protein